MKKIFLFSILVAGILTSCTKDEFAKNYSTNEEGSIIFVANADNYSDTKTVLDGLNIKWIANDPVMIFGKDSESTAKVSGYRAHADGGSVTLDWYENISGTEGAFVDGETPEYALYPSDKTGASISGSTITFNLPDTQRFVANSFGQNANVAVGQVTSVEGIANIKFKNVCGYLKLQLSVASGDAATVGKIVLTTKGDEKLWGKFTVDASQSEPKATYSTGGGKTIVLTCEDGAAVSDDASNPTIFYFVVPDGSLADGFTAEVYSKQDHLMKTLDTDNDITIARNEVNKMKNVSFNWIPTTYAEIEYLQCDGHQCIDTGYGNTGGWRFKFAFDHIEIGINDKQAICGVMNSGSPTWAYTALDDLPDYNCFRYMYNSSDSQRYFTGEFFLGYHTIDASFIQSQQSLFIDGVNKSVPKSANPILYDFSACICGAHRIESVLVYKPAPLSKWYYCDMYDCTNTQIRQFIPAYKSTGETGHQYGMYDVLNDKFYTNVYTGTGACDFNGSI